MQIISSQEELEQLCPKLENESVIFMDTEFYRRKTYYAKLCLIQIATKEQKIIIDALPLTNLTPIKNLLLNDKVCKVFHAPDQDFDIFLHLFGHLPNNIFDTQTAAGVIGLDEVMGYGRLCKALLNVNIDKTMQSADWSERPLNDDLIEYAIKDVEYLIPLYRELTNTLTGRDLWETYKFRSQKLLDPQNYKIRPEKFIKKIGLQARSESFKENFSHFIMLREECAQNADLPRGYCASDYDLIKICEKLPVNDKDLVNLQIDRLPIAKKGFKFKLFELCLGIREL